MLTSQFVKINRELEQEKEKNAKSETSTISSYKAKLSSAEQKVKDAGLDALKASQEVDAVKELSVASPFFSFLKYLFICFCFLHHILYFQSILTFFL